MLKETNFFCNDSKFINDIWRVNVTSHERER